MVEELLHHLAHILVEGHHILPRALAEALPLNQDLVHTAVDTNLVELLDDAHVGGVHDSVLDLVNRVNHLLHPTGLGRVGSDHGEAAAHVVVDDGVNHGLAPLVAVVLLDHRREDLGGRIHLGELANLLANGLLEAVLLELEDTVHTHLVVPKRLLAHKPTLSTDAAVSSRDPGSLLAGVVLGGLDQSHEARVLAGDLVGDRPDVAPLGVNGRDLGLGISHVAAEAVGRVDHDGHARLELLDELDELVELGSTGVGRPDLRRARLHVEVVGHAELQDLHVLRVHTGVAILGIVLTLRADTDVDMDLLELIGLGRRGGRGGRRLRNTPRAVPGPAWDTADVQAVRVKPTVAVVAKKQVSLVRATLANGANDVLIHVSFDFSLVA